MIVNVLASLLFTFSTGGCSTANQGRDAINEPTVPWRISTSTGRPVRGRLENGILLPPEGAAYGTWDPGLKSSPSREFRRWGSDRLLRATLCVLKEDRTEHPNEPRVLIGDIALEGGGDFGPEYGGLGHASHQNGLDVDVYYPRNDGLEMASYDVSQMNRVRSQDLVNRFVAAGAEKIFVGPHTGLIGPPGIVQVIAHHDDHLHVRYSKSDPPTSGVAVATR